MRHLVLISTDARRDHGTGFVVRNLRDSGGAITGAHVVTASHVVRSLGGVEKLRVNAYPARLLVDLAERGIDLAVLEVAGLVDADEVALAAGAAGAAVLLQGFRPPSASAVAAQRRGVLGERTVINERGINRPVWRIEVDAIIAGGESGGPVIDRASGAVVGVIIQGPERGARDAIALAIENLLAWAEGGLAIGSGARGSSSATSSAPAGGARTLAILHLRGTGDVTDDASAAALCAEVDELCRGEDVRPDLIAVTGGLAATGRPGEFAAARALLDRLRARLGLAADRVLVVPGDGDVNRKKCAAYFAACAADEVEPAPPYWPKWEPYAACFGALYADVERYRFTELEPWTWFELPELELVVAGLDSTMRASHLDDEPGGWLGDAQLDWFARRLEPHVQRRWLRLGLVAHDPDAGAEDGDPRGLRDAGALHARLGGKLQRLLSGGGAPRAAIVRLGGTAGASREPPSARELRGPGPRRDDLLAEAIAWCRIHGGERVQVERIAHDGPLGDHALVRDPDDGAWLLGVLDGAPTTELVDLWLRDVVEPFRRRGRGRADARLIAGAAAPIAREVLRHAGARGVRLERLLDYQGVLDLASCRAALRRRLEREPAYQRADYLEQRITPWTGAAAEPGPAIPAAADWLADRLGEPGGRFAVILGAAGVGKSFLLRAVAGRLERAGELVTPLLLDLRQLEVARDLSALAAEHFERLGLPFHPRAFAKAVADGRIALLLDGFDELALRIPPAAKLEAFERIRAMASDGARVAITSRTEQFLSRAAGGEPGTAAELTALGAALAPLARRTIVEVLPFDTGDIRDYLARRLGAVAGAAWHDRLAQATDLIVLAATPRLLAFLIDLPEPLLAEALAAPASLTTAAIYQLAIERSWLADEHGRLLAQRPDLTADQLLDAATQLALRLWRESQIAVRTSDLGGTVGPIVRALAEPERDDTGEVVPRRSLCTRSADGRVRFVHQTVLEWLAARAVAHDLRERNGSEHLAVGRLNGFMIQLLRDLLGIDALAAWTRATLRAGGDGIAAENARDVNERLGLVEHRRADLRNQDLRGQDLRGQDLRGALLDGANLAGVRLAGRDLTGASLRDAILTDADLSDAILAGADLGGADLSFARLHRADLRGARFGGARMLATSLLGARDVPAVLASGPPAPSIVVARPHWPARALAWSPVAGGARVLASAHDDGTVRVWDVFRGRLLRVLTGPRGRLLRVGWSADGEVVVAIDGRGAMLVWDLAAAQAEALAPPMVRASALADLRWAEDDREVIAGDGRTHAQLSVEGNVVIRATEIGPILRVLGGQGAQPEGLAWGATGLFVAGGGVRALRPDRVGSTKFLSIGGETVQAIAVSPDGDRLACAADEVRLWRPGGRGELQELTTLPGARRRARCLAWSPDGSTLAGAGEDGGVWTQSVAGDAPLRELGAHHDAVWALAWSPDGTRLASSGVDEAIALWDPESARVVHSTLSSGGTVWSLAWRRATPRALVLLAAGTSSGTIGLFHEDGTPYHQFRAHDDWVLDLAWSPDGSTLASVSADRTVRLWAWNGGDLQRELRGHGGSVLALAWSPDGLHLATTSADQTMRIWRVADGACVAIVHSSPTGWVAFLDDGRYQVHGDVADSFWHVIGLHRYDLGELDELMPHLRLPPDRPLLHLADEP